MPYVFSTATRTIDFVEYSKPDNPRVLPAILRKVTVKGGANVADKHVHTPNGVATLVTDDDMAFLVGNAEFNRAVKCGFMRIERDQANMDSVVNDMTPKDGCAPKVPGDFEQDPKTGTAKAA